MNIRTKEFLMRPLTLLR